jgi:hypothetical protein
MSRGLRISAEQLNAHLSGVKSKTESPLEKLRALGRMKAGVMNKTEARYADHLEWQKHMREILWYSFEPMALKLAPKTFYRPDFVVLTKEMILQIHEVKGSLKIIQDDARAKIHVAANMFPFVFLLVVPKKGEGWAITEV